MHAENLCHLVNEVLSEDIDRHPDPVKVLYELYARWSLLSEVSISRCFRRNPKTLHNPTVEKIEALHLFYQIKKSFDDDPHYVEFYAEIKASEVTVNPRNVPVRFR